MEDGIKLTSDEVGLIKQIRTQGITAFCREYLGEDTKEPVKDIKEPQFHLDRIRSQVKREPRHFAKIDVDNLVSEVLKFEAAIQSKQK